MGSPLSGLIAILYMDTMKNRALQQINTIVYSRKLVDECFFLTKCKETALEFRNSKEVLDWIAKKWRYPQLAGLFHTNSRGWIIVRFLRKRCKEKYLPKLPIKYRKLNENGNHMEWEKQDKWTLHKHSQQRWTSYGSVHSENILKLNEYPTSWLNARKTRAYRASLRVQTA